MCSVETGAPQTAREREMRAAFQFVYLHWKGKFGSDASQAFDDVGSADGAVDVERLGASGVGDHEEDAG
jgi:hypothetical protein